MFFVIFAWNKCKKCPIYPFWGSCTPLWGPPIQAQADRNKFQVFLMAWVPVPVQVSSGKWCRFSCIGCWVFPLMVTGYHAVNFRCLFQVRYMHCSHVIHHRVEPQKTKDLEVENIEAEAGTQFCFYLPHASHLSQATSWPPFACFAPLRLGSGKEHRAKVEFSCSLL